jgi:CBS domain-containing protein
VPVVNERDEVVGVVTDRDACIALGTRDERASRIRAGDVMSVPVYSCAPEDTLDAALATMRMHRIRRLPVLGIGGVLLGMVSLSDLLRRGEAPSDAIVSALRAVCTSERHVPVALVE